MTYEEIEESIQTKLAKAWGETGIQPEEDDEAPEDVEASVWAAILPMLFDFAIAVLNKCREERGLGIVGRRRSLSAKKVIRTASSPTIWNRWAVRKVVKLELMKEHGLGAYHKMDGPRIVETLLRACSEASEDEVRALLVLPQIRE